MSIKHTSTELETALPKLEAWHQRLLDCNVGVVVFWIIDIAHYRLKRWPGCWMSDWV
jgi:hypothetical protein